MSHVTRKLVYAICQQQRRRSVCASAQSDQCFCFCCLDSIITCYSRNFKTLASLCSWAGWFESYLIKHPEDRFFHDKAHICFQTSPTSTFHASPLQTGADNLDSSQVSSSQNCSWIFSTLNICMLFLSQFSACQYRIYDAWHFLV